ncbi:alpha/beta hydrolase [Engelhardtia mirabilis]|uniref:Phospholipase YtpA n=1 Tax=Engelhardtia mirabilis TaxID=2528011 RepID=A0A518BDZ8_9BACT|nr:Phospholipase YtpA [Planctomycetes bacterium Pla133]QDU99518.1 Phospholipase YtpA [Planctomycetes bacterium Pla86]
MSDPHQSAADSAAEFEIFQGARRFHCRIRSPEGRPEGRVLLVHGLGEHSGRYGGLIERFTGRSLEVVSFDLEGHGLSAGRRGHTSFEATYDAIEELDGIAVARRGPCPTFVYGHSLGGAIALGFARDRRPELVGMIAASPGLEPATAVPEARLWFGRLAASVAPWLTVSNGLDLEGLSRDPAIVAAYRTDRLNHGRISVGLGLETLRRGKELLRGAAAIEVPLLLMHGSADVLTSAAASQSFATTAGCDFKLWGGLFHELHHEPERDEVLTFVLEWIERRISSAVDP